MQQDFAEDPKVLDCFCSQLHHSDGVVVVQTDRPCKPTLYVLSEYCMSVCFFYLDDITCGKTNKKLFFYI